jgi:hypothetical protein
MIRLVRYLKSEKFKNKIYHAGILGLMATSIYFLTGPLIRPNRAETGGYDGYDDD